MPDITRRETLLLTAGATLAASLEARAGDAPKAAEPAPAAGTKRTTRPVSVRDFERLAPESMSRPAWEFINAGAGDEHTVRWNEEAYARLQHRQRNLEDVTRLDTRIRPLGRERPH